MKMAFLKPEKIETRVVINLLRIEADTSVCIYSHITLRFILALIMYSLQKNLNCKTKCPCCFSDPFTSFETRTHLTSTAS